MSDADAISYLNRTIIPTIGDESLRIPISELSGPPHQPKWPRASACGAPRCNGTRCVKHEACLLPALVAAAGWHVPRQARFFNGALLTGDCDGFLALQAGTAEHG